MATFAGRYDEVLLERRDDGIVKAVTGAEVTVYEQNGVTEATLYDDRNKSNTVAQPISVDNNGNLEFFAEPGTYVVEVAVDGVVRSTNTVTVPVDWNEITITEDSIYNVLDYGAVGNGTDDDAAAIQSAFDDANADGGGTVLFPAGTYQLSAAITYDTTGNIPIHIIGVGKNSLLRPTGSTNKVFHITGSAGVTRADVIIERLKIHSQAGTSSGAGIHVSGIAGVYIHDVVIDGDSKMDYGILLSAAQQGEISGGYIERCTAGIRMESLTGVSSNGIDLHGVSLANLTSNVEAIGVDSCFIRGNHMTRATTSVETSSGNGFVVVAFNHFEDHTTAGVSISGKANVLYNNYYPGTGGVDLTTSNADYSVIEGNLLNGDVTLDSTSDSLRFANNTTGGVVTDNSTNITKYGNRNFSGTPLTGSQILDQLKVTSRESSAGNIAEFRANGSVGGEWGARIIGAGAGQDVYLQLHNGVIAGSTGSDVIRIMSGIGGTVRATFNSSGLTLPAALDHDGGTAGFFGTAPASQPSLTYSRTGETTQEAQIRTALSTLGLVADNTTA